MIALDRGYDCGEWVMWSNGQAAVFIPSPQHAIEGLRPKPAKLDVDAYLGRPTEPGSARALLDAIRLPHCPLCKDSRVRECPTCNGEGACFVTCDNCDDRHRCPCRECDETGRTACVCDRPARIVIGGLGYDQRLVRAVLEYMGVTAETTDLSFAGHSEDDGGVPKWDVVLRVQGCFGIVMGRRYDTSEGPSWP